MLHEVLLERTRRVHLDKDCLLLACNVEIHQRQTDVAAASRFTEKPSVDAQLRPVQRAMIGRNAIDVAAIGLELLQLVCLRIIAIRASADVEQAVVSREGQFPLIIRTAASTNDAMTGDAFLGGGRRRKAHVQITLLRRELTEHPNGDLALWRRSIADVRGSGCLRMRHENCAWGFDRWLRSKHRTALDAASIQAPMQ